MSERCSANVIWLVWFWSYYSPARKLESLVAGATGCFQVYTTINPRTVLWLARDLLYFQCVTDCTILRAYLQIMPYLHSENLCMSCKLIFKYKSHKQRRRSYWTSWLCVYHSYFYFGGCGFSSWPEDLLSCPFRQILGMVPQIRLWIFLPSSFQLFIIALLFDAV
jgi:hypothetical protein